MRISGSFVAVSAFALRLDADMRPIVRHIQRQLMIDCDAPQLGQRRRDHALQRLPLRRDV
jgi:hypothetical protein